MSIASLSGLARAHVPLLSALAHSNHVALFEGVLPAVLLGAALYYLPAMLRAAVRQTGYETGAALEAAVMGRLALFLFYNQVGAFRIFYFFFLFEQGLTLGIISLHPAPPPSCTVLCIYCCRRRL